MAKKLAELIPDPAVFGKWREPPVFNLVDWSTVGKVRSALANLLNGQFLSAADLVDAMLGDDRIGGCLDQRTQGLLGAELVFTGQGTDELPDALVDEVKKLWPTMFPAGQLEQLLMWGRMLGVGLGQLVWETGDQYVPQLKIWHPRHLYWRWDTESFWLSTTTETFEVKPGTGEWVLYTPYGWKRGWVRGLVRGLAIPWLIRAWGTRDWARASEVHGIPTRLAYVPASGDEAHKERFIQSVLQLSREPVIKLEVDATAANPREAGYGLDLLEASADNWEVFDNLIARMDVNVAIRLLGQNLTTEISKNGSRAAAAVHDQVRTDLKLSDSETLGGCLRDQVLKPWLALNKGADPERAPRPSWDVEPPEDLGEDATTLKTLGDGLQSLRTAGVYADTEKLAERFGLPLVSPEQAAQLKVEDDARDQAKLDAQTAAAKQPPPGEGQPPPQKRQAASQRAGRGLLEGQAYVDALAEAGRVEAGRRIRSADLRKLLDVLDQGDSYEEIRANLVKAFGELDPEHLAGLVEKCLVLAELNGRAAVLEDI